MALIVAQEVSEINISGSKKSKKCRPIFLHNKNKVFEC